MKTLLRLAALLLAGYAAALGTGCSCDCEVQCTQSGGTTYSYTTVEMRRSECEELNDVGPDSCSYRCAD